jgi:hypothetical protein
MRQVPVLIPFLAASVYAALSPASCPAQEAKPDKLPRIIVASPLAVAAGVPVKLALRGLLLDEITGIKIGDAGINVEIASKGKAAVPQNYDAKRIGDTQVEAKFTLPAETPPGRLALVAVSPGGTGLPYEITVVKSDELIEEKEPNDGFKTAQLIAVGKTVVGTIHDARNVDVFEFKGQAGQKLVATVLASQAGSPLDPVLTLYDSAGQVVAGNDDSDGRDPRLETVLAKPGSYFLCVQDANDAGGPHFAYLLKIAP